MALTVNSGYTSNLDIDSAGNIWLPSTAPAGVAVFSPSTGTFSGPYTQTGVVQPQNIAINSTGLVYATDAGSGLLAAWNPNGSTAGTTDSSAAATGAVAIGPNDEVWYTASTGGSNFLNEINGGLLTNLLTNLLTGFTTYPAQSLSIAANNDVYSATTSGTTGYIEKFNASFIIPFDSVVTTLPNAGLGQLAANGSTFIRSSSGNNTFCQLSGTCSATAIAGLNAPQGVATDGFGRLWFADSGSASVSVTNGSANGFTDFAGIAYKHPFTMVQPYGIGIDASGNVWVSNQTAPGGPYVLSELIGAASPTITPLAAQIAGGTSHVGTRPTN
jgi:sugar lactone lactonase YvrE